MAEKITQNADGSLNVSDEPIIPFIEGDGTGVDIWPASQLVLDAAAAKYGKKVAWKEVLAGEKAFNATGDWLPEETVQSFRDHLIGIKGPLTTPVGGGIRSLNVALRQILDLYVCLRPVRYFAGVPSPVKHPELVDMVIFRENTEDVYAGMELQAFTPEAKKLADFVKSEFGWNIRADSGFGLKPISEFGSKRLIRAAVQYAVDRDRKSVTMVHKGNIMKFTEGAFRSWGYDLVREEFSDVAVGWDDCDGNPGDKILVKDAIADITLQQVLTRPSEFDVIATPNLNGDYLSDALAAQVGGIGIAPGGNINYVTGHGVFEATHGTAPKYAGQDKVNPGSVILSGVMMYEHLGWQGAADLIVKAMEATIADKVVTYDFAAPHGRRDRGQVLAVRAGDRRPDVVSPAAVVAAAAARREADQTPCGPGRLEAAQSEHEEQHSDAGEHHSHHDGGDARRHGERNLHPDPAVGFDARRRVDVHDHQPEGARLDLPVDGCCVRSRRLRVPEALVVGVSGHCLTGDRGRLEPVGPQLEVSDLVDRHAVEERLDVVRRPDPDEHLFAVRGLDRDAEPHTATRVDRSRINDRRRF